MIYEKHYTVAPSDMDALGRLKPSALLYYAQEAAGDHAALLGTDWETLQEQGLFWAVIRTRTEIFSQPQLGERVTVKTWPLPTTRTAYPRCVMGYDSDGTLLFKVLSLWVLMDVKSRAMVLPGKSGVTVEGQILGGEPETPKGLPVKEAARVESRMVSKGHLDRNGHMNNTRYMDWVMELAPKDRAVHSFELCYFNEGRLGDEMELGSSFCGDILTVDIHRKNTNVHDKKERIFAASVSF